MQIGEVNSSQNHMYDYVTHRDLIPLGWIDSE